MPLNAKLKQKQEKIKEKQGKIKEKAKNYAAKKIFHVDIIEAVATDCLAAGFMADIDRWMQASEEEFKKASVGSDPTGKSGSMYTIQQTAMHKEFTAFVDANMNAFVQKHKKTVPQFFEMCAKITEAAPQVQAFIDLLTSASEFPIFVDMMSNREKREYFFYVMRSWRSELDRAKAIRDAAAGNAVPTTPHASPLPSVPSQSSPAIMSPTPQPQPQPEPASES